MTPHAISKAVEVIVRSDQGSSDGIKDPLWKMRGMKTISASRTAFVHHRTLAPSFKMRKKKVIIHVQFNHNNTESFLTS
jgi:hypothetical protein